MTDDSLERECDLEFFVGGGPGGQHRNKTASAVRLRHRPTGIVVVASERRSQHENRAVALERLRAKLEARRRRRKPRVKTRPTRAARTRRLETKRRSGAKKAGRTAPGEEG
jgi:protein subunit release factor A